MHFVQRAHTHIELARINRMVAYVRSDDCPRKTVGNFNKNWRRIYWKQWNQTGASTPNFVEKRNAALRFLKVCTRPIDIRELIVESAYERDIMMFSISVFKGQTSMLSPHHGSCFLFFAYCKPDKFCDRTLDDCALLNSWIILSIVLCIVPCGIFHAIRCLPVMLFGTSLSINSSKLGFFLEHFFPIQSKVHIKFKLKSKESCRKGFVCRTEKG